jgi:hypothetical protein
MFTSKRSSFMRSAWFMGGVVLILGYTLVPARGDIVSISPDAFGPSAHTETFEGIVGVDLPLDSAYSPTSTIPTGYQFASGLVVADESVSDVAGVFDFNAYGFVRPAGMYIGYGLGMEGGSIYGLPEWTVGGPPAGSATTTLPSGSAILTLHNGYATFGFDSPVAQVGSYFEASIFEMIGIMGDLTMEAFDVDGHSLGSVTSFGDGVANDNALDSWIGLATADGRPLINSVVMKLPVSIYESYGVAVMDNLMFEVPEPTSLLLLLPGALCFCRRR